VEARRRIREAHGQSFAAIGGRNRHSQTEAAAIFERKVQQSLLSGDERRSGYAPLVATVAPEMYRTYATGNEMVLCPGPASVVFHRTSCKLIFLDVIRNELRLLTIFDVPAKNTLLCAVPADSVAISLYENSICVARTNSLQFVDLTGVNKLSVKKSDVCLSGLHKPTDIRHRCVAAKSSEHPLLHQNL
jgi:hypothetical protein